MSVVQVLATSGEHGDDLDGDEDSFLVLTLEVEDLERLDAADISQWLDGADGGGAWRPVAEAADALAVAAGDLDEPDLAARLAEAAEQLRACDVSWWAVAGPAIDGDLDAAPFYEPAELAALFTVVGADEHATAMLEQFHPDGDPELLVAQGMTSLWARGIIGQASGEEEGDVEMAQPHSLIVETIVSPAVDLTLIGFTPEATTNLSARVTEEWAVVTEVVEVAAVEDSPAGIVLRMTLIEAGDVVVALLGAAGALGREESGEAVTRLSLTTGDDGWSHPDLAPVGESLTGMWSIECRWTDGSTTSGGTVDWLDLGDRGLLLAGSTDGRGLEMRPGATDDLAAALFELLPGD